MKRALVLAAIIAGLYWYSLDNPPSDLPDDFQLGDEITFDGHKYYSDWGDSKSIQGCVRRKDRFHDSNMPIISYNLVLATGEYCDTGLVTIKNLGGGNYRWHAPRHPDGTLVFYHVIAADTDVRKELDELELGSSISLVGRISENNKIKSDLGNFVKLMHGNHKFIIVEQISEAGHL